MRIALDVRPALRQGTGVGTYVRELCCALDRADGEHRLAAFSSSLKDRLPDPPWPQHVRTTFHDKRIPVRLLNYLWHRLSWPPVDWFVGGVDVSLSPSPLLLPSSGKKIVSIHDLYYLEHPEHTVREIRRHYVPLVRSHTRRADGLIAISEATRSKAAELLGLDPERIRVCHLDCAPDFDLQPSAEELAVHADEFPNPYFLFVGMIEPRKNLESLLLAFDRVADREPDVELVIAGMRGWKTEAFDAALAEMEHPERVRITGYQPREKLRSLYHGALALAMVSHCEGFGLPLVEAMACGCPLVIRNTSAMPEVAGGAAAVWQGESADDLAGILQTLYSDSEYREALAEQSLLRRAAFSWDAAARSVLALVRDIV